MKLIPEQFRSKTDWFTVKAQDSQSAKIEIIGPIDSWYGLDPTLLTKQILALDVPTIDVFISSPGGDLFGSLAVYNSLKAYNGKVRTFNLGLAASAAALIFMAGEERYMFPEAMLMIHNSMIFTAGNSKDHAASINVLTKLDDLQSRIFAKNSNIEQHRITAMLAAETWFNTNDATAHGFASVWTGDLPKDIPNATAGFDLSIFENVPERVKAVFAEKKIKTEDIKKDMELKIVRNSMESRLLSQNLF